MAEQQSHPRPVALISGAMGLIGRNLAQHLESKGWRVYGIARRELDYGGDRVTHIRADLMDKQQLAEALRAESATDITHIFHCALQNIEDPVKGCEVNLAMLQNVVESAEAAGCQLQHVHCNTGHKWYSKEQAAPSASPQPTTGLGGGEIGAL
jgi:nucleoside-diphosphate-sugar epimerase